MISWVRALVRVIAQNSCGAVRPALIGDIVQSPSSDGWRSRPAQSIVRPSSRGGVPVLSRASGRLERAELAGERRRRALADPAAGAAGHAEMQLAAKEGAGGEDHRLGGQLAAVGRASRPVDPPPVEPKRARLALDDRQARLRLDQRVDRRLVALAVGLDARAAHRRALAGVEHAIVDRGLVGGAGDQAVKGVDLADQMALAEPAHRRVARHRADLARG